jgi:hypothetical protein
MTNTIQVSDSITLPILKLRVSIQTDATPEQAREAIDAVCGALSRQESSVEHLRILLGRMMAEVKDRRLYRPEFATFEAFTQDLMARYRLSRSTVRDAIMIVRRLPTLEPEAAEGIPLTNITLAARAAKGMEPRDVKWLLKSAARMNVIEFRAKVEGDGLLPHVGRPAGKSGMVTLRLRVSKALAARWAALVEGRDAGKVLSGLMASAREAIAA